MPDQTEHVSNAQSEPQRLRRWGVPLLIVFMAVGIVFLITGNWNTWASERPSQETDDAYTRADLTPLSTKVAGLVAMVPVSDYQQVKAGDLLVQLREDDFRAQVEQAEAGVLSGEGALINNRRQKELQDARVAQSSQSVHAAEAAVTAAEAGIEAAKASIANAQSAMAASDADVQRTGSERRRQEALIATESATRQKVEQVVADDLRFRAQLASRQSEYTAAKAQLASRQADLERARAQLGASQAEVEVQKRQRAVFDSQELVLHADLKAKSASLALTRTDLGYTRILAPENGIVSERKVRPGQLVSPGTQVISLVQSEVWVQANYKETQVGHFRAGDPADVYVDALPGVVFRAKVEQVSPASGSQFALLPPDNATGNFTKIVQRIPVKIVLMPGQAEAKRLRPGLSVIAKVRTSTLPR